MSERVSGLTSIVVVAADSGPVLARSIASVLASDARVEVILVDNASADGEVERTEARHAGESRLRVLRNGANLGFGPACNRGAAIARGDALLFLNPDCIVPPDAVARLRARLDAEPQVGLFGACVEDADGLPARGNRRRDPVLRRTVASVLHLNRFESSWPALAGVEMPAITGTPPAVEAVDAVSGACMLLRRSVFEAIGGFDEGYFLHVEDLDLCRRVRDAGWRVAIAHEVHVVHEQGSSSRRRPFFVARHKRRGMWRYFLKFDPAARNPLLRAGMRAGLCLYAAAASAALVIAAGRRRLTPDARR